MTSSIFLLYLYTVPGTNIYQFKIPVLRSCIKEQFHKTYPTVEKALASTLSSSSDADVSPGTFDSSSFSKSIT